MCGRLGWPAGGRRRAAGAAPAPGAAAPARGRRRSGDGRRGAGLMFFRKLTAYLEECIFKQDHGMLKGVDVRLFSAFADPGGYAARSPGAVLLGAAYDKYGRRRGARRRSGAGLRRRGAQRRPDGRRWSGAPSAVRHRLHYGSSP
ncbi:hypothetical protein AB1Y20_014210 [Prymnesium parvum]|uniref:Uncharacterized protein n=1 Tax=Prymnesium parvum TaxID=97485 RepID=A0AB34ID23_PRYPA